MSKSTKKKRAAGERGSSIVSTQFELREKQCIAILALLVFAFFHKILLGQAYFWEDFLYQNYPFRHFAATSLAMGQLPLWNPYTFNGMPFLADIQTTVFYVPSLFLTIFVRDGSLNFYWLELIIILHFLLAGVGMFYLAKSFKLHNVPSLVAGAAYMLSGYMIVHAIHQQNVTLVAWYPFVVLLFRKALSERGWLYVLLCALVLGHSILAGYPQLSLYLYALLGVYFLFELLTTHSRDQLLSRDSVTMVAKAAAIVVISVALAMIQLLPTFELSDLSQRAQITFEKASEGSLAWSQLATLFFPKMFGTAGANGYEYFGPGQYFYFWETCVYLGILPLLLMMSSIAFWRKSKYIPLLIGLALFSLLFALGDNFVLFKFFYEFVPGFSKFRIPARMGILLVFSASLLTAFSLQYILYEEKADKRTLRNILIASFAVGAAAYALILSGSFAGSLTNVQFSQVADLVAKGVHPSFVLLLISVGLLFLIVLKTRMTQFWGLALVGLLFVDAYLFGGNQNTSSTNPSEYFKRTAGLIDFVKKENESEIFRINTRNPNGMITDRNQGMIDRVFMMEGYTPLALQRLYGSFYSGDYLFDLLNVKFRTVTDTATGNLNFVANPTYLPRAFFLYDMHVVDTEQELLDYLKSPEFQYRKTAVLEKNPGRTLSEPSSAPQWKATITNYENNRIALNVRTSHDGLLVLSETYYPGWKAYVDGIETEIFRTDYNLRSFFVNAGEHKVEVKFEPKSFVQGMWISIGALLIVVVGIVVSIKAKRDDRQT